MARNLVLGAGMVGMGTALALQERGEEVILLDRRAPGEETSYGNAGIIQTEQAEPVSMPVDPVSLFKIATGRTNDVIWHLRAMPDYFKPLLGYFYNSQASRVASLAKSWSPLTRRAIDDHAPLIKAAGAEDLIRQNGYCHITRSSDFLEKMAKDAERLARDFGVESQLLDSAALAAAEPMLRQTLAGAIHWSGTWTCASPGGLVKAYGALFQARGGQIVTGDAQSLRQTATGWQCQSSDGPIEAERVVLALGPWSTQLTQNLGYKIPLFRKRGYHWHLQNIAGPTLPLFDNDNGVMITPMVAGVRVTSGVELTGFDTPINPRQINHGIRAAQALFELGAPVEPQPWFGNRPCLPDMLPLIGPAPRHKGLWFNFGHAHQGFTLGPTTGKLLAEMMGQAQPPQTNPFGYRWS